VQKFDAVPKTVTKVRGNGDGGSRFDGRHNGGKTVVLFHQPNKRRVSLSFGSLTKDVVDLPRTAYARDHPPCWTSAADPFPKAWWQSR